MSGAEIYVRMYIIKKILLILHSEKFYIRTKNAFMVFSSHIFLINQAAKCCFGLVLQKEINEIQNKLTIYESVYGGTKMYIPDTLWV
jgi:hypothetical protein